jgi:hypothetical protein
MREKRNNYFKKKVIMKKRIKMKNERYIENKRHIQKKKGEDKNVHTAGGACTGCMAIVDGAPCCQSQ